MRKPLWMLAVMLALAPVVALGQDVSVNYDKTYDFSKLKTFAVQVASQAQDPFLEKHLVSTVSSTLASKGWTQAEAATADATVMLHGQSETRQKLEAYSTGGYRWGGGMGTAKLEDYTVGTLVVDIFETKTKTLLFRGTASDEKADKAEKNEKKIDKAVNKIFKDFPPGSRK